MQVSQGAHRPRLARPNERCEPEQGGMKKRRMRNACVLVRKGVNLPEDTGSFSMLKEHCFRLPFFSSVCQTTKVVSTPSFRFISWPTVFEIAGSATDARWRSTGSPSACTSFHKTFFEAIRISFRRALFDFHRVIEFETKRKSSRAFCKTECLDLGEGCEWNDL